VPPFYGRGKLDGYKKAIKKDRRIMQLHPFERAINKQLKSFTIVDGIEDVRGLTKEQIWHPKERTEDILVKMIDELRPIEKRSKSKRMRRRGPKVILYKP
jgi:hypothetical protein